MNCRTNGLPLYRESISAERGENNKYGVGPLSIAIVGEVGGSIKAPTGALYAF